MSKVTIYSTPTEYGMTVRCGKGSYTDAAMFNTLVNLIRLSRLVINCYYCAVGQDNDDGYYTTSDGQLYQVRNG